MATPTSPRLMVRASGGTWGPPAQAGYLSEAEMQRMLASQPSLLPGVGPGAIAVQEFSTGAGPSDVVVVDTDGAITVVECKLHGNEEIRRKVIGQVLDYASRLWRMSVEDFDARWRQRAGTSLLDQLDQCAVKRLEEDLESGRFTLVLAVDHINSDLRRIVEYLNVHTTETIRLIAMELDKAEHSGVEILIPTVYGEEIADAKVRESGGRHWVAHWTADDVLSQVQVTDASLASDLADFVEQLSHVGADADGTGGQLPSMNLGRRTASGSAWPFSVYTGDKKHTLSLNFQWLTGVPPEAREPFLLEVSAVLPALDAPAVRAAAYSKRPGVDLISISEPSVRAALVKAALHLMESTEA